MSLEDLPSEVIECIVEFLPLHEICNLRLTGRSLASKATQTYFKENFYAKRIEISERGLSKLVAATESSGLACLLQGLTLVTPVYSTVELEQWLEHTCIQVAMEIPICAEEGTFKEPGLRHLGAAGLQRIEVDVQALQQQRDEHLDLLQRGRDIKLLSQAFDNLVKRGVTLRSICAAVAVYRTDAKKPLLPLYGGGWRHIWAATANGANAILASLATTGLCVEKLDLFDPGQMQRCSLPCDTLTALEFSSNLPKMSLGNLQVLSMSVSDKNDFESDLETTTGGDFGDYWSMLVEKSKQVIYPGIRSMLSQCLQLKELGISETQGRDMWHWSTGTF